MIGNRGFIIDVMDIVYPLMSKISTYLLTKTDDITASYLTPIVDELVTQAFECLDVDMRVMWHNLHNYPRYDLVPLLNRTHIGNDDHLFLKEAFCDLTMKLWIRVREEGLLIEGYPMRLEKVTPSFLVVRL